MRKFAPASALAAGVLVSAFMAAPAASVTHARAAPGPLSPIQPGGPISAAGGRTALFSHPGEATANVVSNNWGGYAALRTHTHFRYVQATFFVPYVDCSSTSGSFSGHWVGIDGLGNGTVEQDGILAACNGSTPVYAAWWEMFPRPPVYPNITLNPGDSIVASVYYSKDTHKFRLSLADTGNGQHFRVIRACPAGSTCQRTSAEAISEAPSNGSSILPLANFRAESYSGIRVTSAAGRHGGLRARWWDTLSVTTENSSSQVLDQPTSIFRGTAFDMYWMRES